MTDQELRLKCLKLALEQARGTLGNVDVTGLAGVFYDFATASDKQPVEQPATPIDALDFSTRTWNMLESLGIKTVEELVTFSAIDLLRQPNFGRKSLREIEAELADRGLHLSTTSRLSWNGGPPSAPEAEGAAVAIPAYAKGERAWQPDGKRTGSDGA